MSFAWLKLKVLTRMPDLSGSGYKNYWNKLTILMFYFPIKSAEKYPIIEQKSPHFHQQILN
jgi:hypothetical protein